MRTESWKLTLTTQRTLLEKISMGLTTTKTMGQTMVMTREPISMADKDVTRNGLTLQVDRDFANHHALTYMMDRKKKIPEVEE
jgi:hypothetical protein